MNYGLYLSATGIMASAYRQDVIANNLANSETTGFKRDLALFRERRTESQERGGIDPDASNPLLEDLTGGTLAAPTLIDRSQGDLEATGNSSDCAIEGTGYFMVDDNGTQRLTRNGQFITDAAGNLIVANSVGQRVLGPDRKPITLQPNAPIAVGKDGTVTQNGAAVARVGLFDVPDLDRLTKHGGTMLDYPDMDSVRTADTSVIHGGFIERSNVDPAVELSQLMSAQRELEANANMIRYQDQTLSRLVNDVAKVG
jgi:flagellar basal body rod protein FlgG